MGPCLSCALGFRAGCSTLGAAYSGKITFFDLLFTQLLIQPRMPLAFWAANCWVLFIFCSPLSPSSSLEGCSQFLHPSGCIDAGECPDWAEDLNLTLLNLMRFTQAHPTHLSVSLWTISLPTVNWVYHPVWCHLQSCWRHLEQVAWFYYLCYWCKL